MEIKASQQSLANGQDLPNSPPDRLSSIDTTAAVQDSSQTLSLQSSSSSNKSYDQVKTLSNETLQKLTSNPAFYNALSSLFQNKNKSLQNSGQNLFPQLQQLQQISQHLSQQAQGKASQNLLSENQSKSIYSQKSTDVLNPPSSDEFQSGSPAPSGRRSPSFATSTLNKTLKKNEKAPKKTKNKNLTKNKNNLITRQDSRFNHPQKIIFTPTFKLINNDTTDPDQATTETTDPSVADFDIIEAHKRLEIYEDRIIAGKTKYVHPACSVLLEKEETEKSEIEGIPIVYSEEEMLLSQQYEQEGDDYDTFEPQRVPLFWEKRPWDKEDDLMDADESEALRLRITDFNESIFFGDRGLHGKKRNRRPHHQRVKNSEKLILKDEIIEEEYSDYELGYEDYDESDTDDSNSNSDFESTDTSNDDHDEDEDRSGSYHYHMSGISGNNSAGKKQNRKLQRTKSSPISRNINLHHFDSDRIPTRKNSSKKRSLEEPIDEVDSSIEIEKIQPIIKKGQAQYGRQLKKSQKGSRANSRFKIIKTGANSTAMYISNLYFETDDSCDETDGELF